MHYLQKHILDELRVVPSARYSELNTENVESGHFRYHLSQLIKDGYIEQLARGEYRLSDQGRQLVDKLSSGRVNPHAMPKVITYTLLTNNKQVWLQKKPKEPYRGLYNMLGGKLHEGETATQAAGREVQEKAGLTVETPRLSGIFEIFINKDGELHTHVIAYVFCSHVDTQDLSDNSLTGFDIADLPTTENLASDFLPVFNRINGAKSVQFGTLSIDI